MSFRSVTTTFKTGVGAAGTLINVPASVGTLTPVAICVTMFGRTDVADAAGLRNIVFCRGWAVSPSSRLCLVAQAVTGVTPSATDKAIRTDALLMSLSTAGAINGALNVNAFSADNVQLIISTQFSTDYTVVAEIFAGIGFAASIVLFTKSIISGAGTRDISLGVVPKCMEILSIQSATAIGTVAPSAGLTVTLSRAIVATGQNQCLMILSDDNLAASDSRSYANDVESILGLATATTLGSRGSIIGPSDAADGIKVSYSANNTASTKYAALCFTGDFQVNQGFINSLTDTTTHPTADPGFVPVVTSLWSHGLVESTLNSFQNGAELSIGAFSGQFGTTQLCGSFNDPDNVNPTASATAQRFSSVYANLDGSGAIEGALVIDGSSGSTTAWAYHMSVAEAAQRFVLWQSFGEPPAGFDWVPSIQLQRSQAMLAASSADPEITQVLRSLPLGVAPPVVSADWLAASLRRQGIPRETEDRTQALGPAPWLFGKTSASGWGPELPATLLARNERQVRLAIPEPPVPMDAILRNRWFPHWIPSSAPTLTQVFAFVGIAFGFSRFSGRAFSSARSPEE